MIIGMSNWSAYVVGLGVGVVLGAVVLALGGWYAVALLLVFLAIFEAHDRWVEKSERREGGGK